MSQGSLASIAVNVHVYCSYKKQGCLIFFSCIRVIFLQQCILLPLTSILFLFTCYLRHIPYIDQCSSPPICPSPLTHTHAHLPWTIPFRQRQNKLIRSEVWAYQQGISIQIEALSGHKQQEAKQDPGAAEWEDERQGETKKEGECVRRYGGGSHWPVLLLS